VEDRVTLSGLRLLGRHGVTADERTRPQPFRVDISCPTDVARAARADEIASTLDYRSLRDIAAAVIEGPSRNLVETLAEEIARRVLEELGRDWVRVRVTKERPGSIEGEAAIEIERHRGGIGAPIELHVADFAVAKDFYGRLGFAVVREEPPPNGYLVMALGATRIAFWPGSDRVEAHRYFRSFSPKTPKGFGVEIVVAVDDVLATYERMRHVAKVVAPLQRRPWGPRDFRLADPFGFYLRITE